MADIQDSYPMSIFDNHQQMLRESAVPPAIAAARGYVSIDSRAQLQRHVSGGGFEKEKRTPGLLIPMRWTGGEIVGYQYRPDLPGETKTGKKRPKYVSPTGRAIVMDIHPSQADKLVQPDVPLWITEGVKKGDAAAAHGIPCIALSGVDNWQDRHGALPQWADVNLDGRTVYIAFDSDAYTKRAVREAAGRLYSRLELKRAKPAYLIVPAGDGSKTGLDDYLAAGGSVTELIKTATHNLPHAVAPLTDLQQNRLDLLKRNHELEHRGHMRMAIRFAREHNNQVVHVPALGWLKWDGRRWKEVTDAQLYPLVARTVRAAKKAAVDLGDPRVHGPGKDLYDDAKTAESANGANGVLRLASGQEEIHRDIEQLDANPALVNTPTGTFNLDTGQLQPNNPQDLCTKITRAEYDRTALADAGTRFNTFIERVLPDLDVRDYVQKAFGMAMYGTPLEQALILCTGEGANGKSTLIELIHHAIGDYGGICQPQLLAETRFVDKFALADLVGVRFAITSETNEAAQLNVAMLKRLTGETRGRAERKFKPSFEFEYSHTLVMATNHPPQVDGTDPAAWRRLKVVPFDVVIPAGERDPDLLGKLREESSAVLSWLVLGYKLYRETGLKEPEAVREKTEQVRADNNAVGRFVEECCMRTTAGAEKISVLYERWTQWTKVNGEPSMDQQKFKAALDREGFPNKRRGSGRVVVGLVLLADESGDENRPTCPVCREPMDYGEKKHAECRW
ncbi:phage/plasmid primase, P4 family [Micromonospora humi]|uniref:Putative DNA primase/helicase n=1 Tax=Micromonospora humi TaxID=745366 RepID=A0A1C5HLE6_9ACTN|nr:phage/plasmid primase, P4 family [Micromonospora humi]SCG46826.1 putative DNA primase/helicase [Micromonospora humi]